MGQWFRFHPATFLALVQCYGDVDLQLRVTTGAAERKHMSLVGNLRRHRKLRDRFEVERILDGIHSVSARTMRDIREERNAVIRDTLPAPLWNLRLGLSEWTWVARFMVEQRVLNLLR